MDMDHEYQTVSKFDRQVGGLLAGNNLHTKATTIKEVGIIGSQTFIVQTIRDEQGDHVVIEYLDNDGPIRMVLIPKVVNTIVRQRDALTARARSNSSKQVMRERMAAGELPGFMSKRKPAPAHTDKPVPEK